MGEEACTGFVSRRTGSGNKHPTIDQFQRVTTIIEKAFIENKIRNAMFLDESQLFGRVWQQTILNYGNPICLVGNLSSTRRGLLKIVSNPGRSTTWKFLRGCPLHTLHCCYSYDRRKVHRHIRCDHRSKPKAVEELQHALDQLSIQTMYWKI